MLLIPRENLGKNINISRVILQNERNFKSVLFFHTPCGNVHYATDIAYNLKNANILYFLQARLMIQHAEKNSNLDTFDVFK